MQEQELTREQLNDFVAKDFSCVEIAELRENLLWIQNALKLIFEEHDKDT